MRRLRPAYLPLLASTVGLWGCSQASVLSYKTDSGGELDSASSSEDGSGTGEVIEQEPDYGDDGGSGSSEGSGDDGGTEVTYDLSSWSGSRTYSIDKRAATETDCSGDTVAETGEQIVDPERLELLAEACSICVDFYDIAYALSQACAGDIDLSRPEVRGFVYRGSDLEIWQILEAGTELEVERELNDGDYDEGAASYRYERDWNGDGTTTITGELAFAVVE